MLRLVMMICVMGLLTACGGANDINDKPVPLGNFNLMHNVVVAPKAQKGPLSRDATEEQLTTAVQKAIAQRFDRYEGDSNYHFGVSVEGYVLAAPGVPLVLSPKSILILNLTVWDDAAGKKLTDKPHTITVLETFGTGNVVGSGYTLSAEEQLEQLSENAAKAIERYLVKQMKEEGWFVTTGSGRPGAKVAGAASDTPPATAAASVVAAE